MPLGTAQQVDELRSDPTASPAETRQRVLRLIREVGETDAALWYTMGQVDEGWPLPVQWETLGVSRAAPRQMRDEQITWPERDPRRPALRELRSFQSFSTLIQDWESYSRSPVYQRVFLPYGVHDQLRLLVYANNRFIGWVGGLRATTSPTFSRTDSRRLQPFCETIASALVQADATERASHVEEGCDLFVRPDGQVEFASQSGRRWLDTPGHEDLIRRWIRRIDREGASPRHLGGWPLRWSRLCGSHGTRYLLHLSMPAPLVVHPLDRLPPRQREVAQLAAAGATIPEIARMVERSRETVRTHLREVYRRLDVSSRAELAQVLATADG